MFVRRMAWGLMALSFSATLAWADPVAQVVKLSGNVELIRGSTSVNAVLGNALEPGDKLKTDASSRIRVQLLDGSTINIGSQSEFSIDDVVSKGPGTERKVGLELWLGVLLAHAEKAIPQSRFVITTPKATTAVRGTQWGIYSLPAQSDVVVLDGSVGVRQNVVSGASALSLTRSLGVTVTDAGLGPVTRWPKERVDALLAATDVPGPEVPFNLEKATGIDNTQPIILPEEQPAPQPLPQPQPQKKKKKCASPGDDACTIDRDKGGRY